MIYDETGRERFVGGGLRRAPGGVRGVPVRFTYIYTNEGSSIENDEDSER